MWSYKVDSPGHLTRVDVPAPDPEQLADGDVLLRVEAAGICGSDIARFNGRVKPSDPTVGFPLHELCGRIVASRDPNLAVGTRVVGMARGSRGFSEIVVTRGDYCREVGGDLPAWQATMIQPLATVLSAVSRLPDPRGKHVAVIGQGPLGLLFSHVLASLEAGRVTAVDRVDRSDVAADFGIDEFVHKDSEAWARDVGEGDRPSIVIEAVGHQQATLADAITACAADGMVFAFGVPDDTYYSIPFELMFRKGLTLVGAVTADYQRFLSASAEYIEAHSSLLRTYITDVVPMERAQAGFELYARPAKGRLKVVLDVVSTP